MAIDQKYAGLVSAFAVMSFGLLISLTILQAKVNIETASIIDHAIVLTNYTPAKRVRTKASTVPPTPEVAATEEVTKTAK